MPDKKLTIKQIIIEPDGWECLIEECQSGHFMFEDDLCFKTEYGMEVYCSSGETFMPRKVLVQPVAIVITKG